MKKASSNSGETIVAMLCIASPGSTLPPLCRYYFVRIIVVHGKFKTRISFERHVFLPRRYYCRCNSKDRLRMRIVIVSPPLSSPTWYLYYVMRTMGVRCRRGVRTSDCDKTRITPQHEYVSACIIFVCFLLLFAGES